MMIEGDQRMPDEIARTSGFVGEQMTPADVEQACREIIEGNKAIVDKVIATGRDGPVMALVGQVMKKLNRRGDPVQIRHTIEQQIQGKKDTAATTAD